MIQRFKPGKKKCKAEGCTESFDKNPHQPFKDWCSPECAVKICNKKKAIKEKKEWASQKKEMVDNIKKYGEWLKDLEDVINPIARLIDWGHACISCGGFGKPQAGHYHTVNSDGTIRFNLHNIHIQDYYCNVHKSANTHGYDEGLIKTYGDTYWNYVKFGLKNIYFNPIKPQIFEIKEKIVICRAIIKELEQNKTERTPEERIRLRDKYNSQIGLYNLKFAA